MGAWGHAVLDDDFVRDVVGDFKDRLKRGESVDVATAATLAEYGEAAGDPDDGPLLWLALAHCQWTYGSVSADVLGHVTADLDSGMGLGRWSDSSADLAKRRDRLVEFVAKVREPNPSLPGYRSSSFASRSLSPATASRSDWTMAGSARLWCSRLTTPSLSTA